MRLRHLIMLAWLAGAWAAMPASGGYLVDSRGAVVRNSYGECWRTGSWTPAQAIAECDPELVTKKITTQASALAPVPPPPPEPKAAPSMAAPQPAPAGAPKAAAKAKSMEPKAVQKNGGGYGITALSVKPDTAAISILEHRWAPILEKGAEGRNFPDYGMYTYVLFGRDPTAPNLDQAVLARYEKVLKAVREQSTAVSTKSSAAEIKANTNLFCVPANGRYFSKLSLDTETYGYQLSQEYLSSFRLLLKQDKNILPSLVSATGPFLLATLQPLGKIAKQPGTPLLFVDLTHTHENVIAETVDAFKGQVIDKRMNKQERITSMRVSLINLLEKANDHVTPVKTAVAGILPQGEKSAKPVQR